MSKTLHSSEVRGKKQEGKREEEAEDHLERLYTAQNLCNKDQERNIGKETEDQWPKIYTAQNLGNKEQEEEKTRLKTRNQDFTKLRT